MIAAPSSLVLDALDLALLRSCAPSSAARAKNPALGLYVRADARGVAMVSAARTVVGLADSAEGEAPWWLVGSGLKSGRDLVVKISDRAVSLYTTQAGGGLVGHTETPVSRSLSRLVQLDGDPGVSAQVGARLLGEVLAAAGSVVDDVRIELGARPTDPIWWSGAGNGGRWRGVVAARLPTP